MNRCGDSLKFRPYGRQGGRAGRLRATRKSIEERVVVTRRLESRRPRPCKRVEGSCIRYTKIYMPAYRRVLNGPAIQALEAIEGREQERYLERDDRRREKRREEPPPARPYAPVPPDGPRPSASP